VHTYDQLIIIQFQINGQRNVTPLLSACEMIKKGRKGVRTTIYQMHCTQYNTISLMILFETQIELNQYIASHTYSDTATAVSE
jgi:hypothetical protein